MDHFRLQDDLKPNSWTGRFQAVFEVLLLSGILSGHLAGFCMSFVINSDRESSLKNVGVLSSSLILESGITFLLLWMVLKVRRERVQNIGLHWNRWKLNLGIGLGLVPFLFIINSLVARFFQACLPGYFTEKNPLTENIRSTQDLGLFIVAAVIAGGIQEELQRAFILNRFDRYLGGAGIGLVLWSIAFGLGHYIQGMQAIVAAGIFSIVFGMVYLGTRSLIAPITAHGIYNSLALLQYWLLRH